MLSLRESDSEIIPQRLADDAWPTHYKPVDRCSRIKQDSPQQVQAQEEKPAVVHLVTDLLTVKSRPNSATLSSRTSSQHMSSRGNDSLQYLTSTYSAI